MYTDQNDGNSTDKKKGHSDGFILQVPVSTLFCIKHYAFIYLLTILAIDISQGVMGQCYGIFVIGIFINKKSTLSQNTPSTLRQYIT